MRPAPVLLVQWIALAACANSIIATSIDIWVDPVRGNDDDGVMGDTAGTSRRPLRTVHAARDTVRRLRRSNPDADITVQLLPGLRMLVLLSSRRIRPNAAAVR